MEDEDLDNSGTGALAAIANQLQDAFDPSTTPEAQEYARQILKRTMSDPYSKTQDQLFSDLEKNTEEARTALRAAREKLMARRFNPADRWYALSAALGSPTETGAKAESLAAAANALRGSSQRKTEYEIAQDKEALGLDERSTALEQQLLALKLNQLGTVRKSDTDLAKEALKTLGRRTAQGNKGLNAVDREYAKDYVDWIQNGEPEASQALTELNSSLDMLHGVTRDKEGNEVPMKDKPNLTGPVIGTISTLPAIGKWAQDVLFPKSANTQEQIESTVQRSLRPILGAQFTEKEGERLISRVYNPRLDEAVNAKRVEWLISKLNVAFKNKQEAAAYFQKHGTLAGFAPKHKFTINDFMPDATTPGEPGYEDQDDLDSDPESPDNNAPAVDPNEPVESEEEIPHIKLEDLPRRKKPLGFMGFAKGGQAKVPSGMILVELPNGESMLVDEGVTQEDLLESLGRAPPDGDSGGENDSSLGRAALGATAGAAAGYAGVRSGVRAATALGDLLPGRGETQAQTRLLQLMERQNTRPAQVVQDVKRAQRRGIPAMPLDVGPEAFRAVAETALPQGGDQTQFLLDRLSERQAGARSRVNDQINNALKPDEYFDKEKELKTRLYGDKATNTPSESRPLYEAAEQQFPAVRSNQLTKLMGTPSGQKAVKAAMKTMQDKGKQIGKVNPVTGVVSKYSLEFLNQVKIELDDMINKAEVKGASAKSSAIKGLRDAFRAELDAATTDPATGDSPYKEARGVYEAGKKNLDTLQAGREFSSLQPQQVKSLVSNMTFEQKDLYRSGVAQSLYEMLNKPSTDINAARKLIGSPEMKSKLSLLFDNPNEFKVFSEALEQEMNMFERSKPLLNQKSTVERRAQAPRGSVVQRGAQKAPTLGIFSPTQWALRWIRSKPEVSEKEAREVIDLLRAETPDQLARFASLETKFGRAAARRKFRGKAGMVGAGFGALGAMLREATHSDTEAAEPETTEEMSPSVEEEDPTLKGLSPEEIEWAKTPAKAKGGKISLLREALESLKGTISPDYRKHLVENTAMQEGLAPSQVESKLQELMPQIMRTFNAPSAAPATGQLELLKRSIEFEKQRLQQLQSLMVQGDRGAQGASQLTGRQAELAQQSNLLADSALERVQRDPTQENYMRLQQLVRQLAQTMGKRRGGSVNRQFGGMTTHA